MDLSISSPEAFEMHDVIEQKYYSLDLQSINGVSTAGYKGVIDSGTSLLVGPTHLVNAMTKGLTVAEDCSNLASLPTIDVVFNGISYPLTPDQYVVKIADSKGADECLMGIHAADFPAGFDYFIVGDPFFRAYPIYFDKEENKVGFLRQAAAEEIEE